MLALDTNILARILLDDTPTQTTAAFNLIALFWYAQGMGFADGLHLALSNHVTQFKTFDNGFISASRRLHTLPPVSLP